MAFTVHLSSLCSRQLHIKNLQIHSQLLVIVHFAIVQQKPKGVSNLDGFQNAKFFENFKQGIFPPVSFGTRLGVS